jgi:hypothetical protein
MDPSAVVVGKMLLLVLPVLVLVLGLLGVLRVPETDCRLVYGWLSVRQYVLLLSVLYALVSNLLGNGDSLTLTSA